VSALGHLRVLDLSRVRAGPSCARIFADFSADVIKIEAPPGKDPNEGMTGPRDGPDMQNLHRSKRSLALDLKDQRGKEILMRLVAGADLVIENFRPGVMDRLGFSWRTLAEANPRLVLVSISGFGEDGPLADRPGFDQIVQGMGGLMSVTGLPGHGPVRAGIAVADLAAGLYGAIGALVALAERERSGRGQWVRTSLLEAQIALMDFQAARWLVAGEVPGQAGNEHPVSVPTGVARTRDGHLNLGVAGDGQWRDLCGVLERPDLAADPRFTTVARRLENRVLVWEILNEEFARADTTTWIDRLAAARVPAGPIYRLDEVFADPQVVHSRIAQPISHPRLGEIALVGVPLRLDRTPPQVRWPTPDSGADTDAVLSELGLTGEEIAKLRADLVVA